MPQVSRQLSTFIALVSLSCARPPDVARAACVSDETAAAAERAPITRGSAGSLLGLSEAEQNAIVFIEVRADAELVSLCSGVLVGGGRILTARHCFESTEGPHVRVVFGPRAEQPVFETDATMVTLQSTADVAVLLLRELPDASLVAPLRPLRDLGELVDLTVAVIAGYGATQELSFGTRLFASVDVVAADEAYFVTSAASLSGACIGDSGGPVLYRDRHGLPVVLGLLSWGSGSCKGVDSYTRLDTVTLDTEARQDTADVAGCADLGNEGACFGPGVAVWCEQGQLGRTECTDGSACGWDPGQSAFRCVEAGTDPCAGISSAGICDGQIARRCVDGSLSTQDCDRCDDRCLRDPTTGRVGCTH